MNHGTESGYTQHVKANQPACPACRTAHRDYTRAYRARQPRPAQRVTPDTARAHLGRLVETGTPLYVIAETAGVNHKTCADILAERRAYIYLHTERAILATDPAHGNLLPAAGTHRRLQALMALGWPLSVIAKRLGVHHDRIRQYLIQRSVYATTAARVAALYDELSMTPGPSVRARREAARRGYVPPLAWDDETIDDPAAWASLGEPVDTLPDPVAVELLVAGAHWHDVPGVTRADRLAAAARLPVGEAEARLGLRHGRDFGREAAA